MYHLKYRPAKRMERRLPSGTTTGSIPIGSLFLRHEGAHLLTFIVLLGATANSLLVSMKYLLPCHLKPSKISDFARQAISQWSWNNLSRVRLKRYKNQFLTLNNMGTDPILKSVKRWHGSHHSNQGGNIQCQ